MTQILSVYIAGCVGYCTAIIVAKILKAVMKI